MKSGWMVGQAKGAIAHSVECITADAAVQQQNIYKSFACIDENVYILFIRG